MSYLLNILLIYVVKKEASKEKKRKANSPIDVTQTCQTGSVTCKPKQQKQQSQQPDTSEYYTNLMSSNENKTNNNSSIPTTPGYFQFDQAAMASYPPPTPAMYGTLYICLHQYIPLNQHLLQRGLLKL